MSLAGSLHMHHWCHLVGLRLSYHVVVHLFQCRQVLEGECSNLILNSDCPLLIVEAEIVLVKETEEVKVLQHVPKLMTVFGFHAALFQKGNSQMKTSWLPQVTPVQTNSLIPHTSNMCLEMTVRVSINVFL